MDMSSRVLRSFFVFSISLISYSVFPQNEGMSVEEHQSRIVGMYSQDVAFTPSQRKLVEDLALQYAKFSQTISSSDSLTLQDRVEKKKSAFFKMDSTIVSLLSVSQKKALEGIRSERQSAMNAKKSSK
jgi:hypothetical protein